MTLTGPAIMPASGAPQQLVVILHGYGADGEDMIGLGQVWQGNLPDALFVAPNAPEPCAGNPFGYQWFALDLQNPQTRIIGARQARPQVEAFLRDLWAQTGLGPADTVLAGFSQGAMMALHVGLQLEQKLAGILAMSGSLIVPDRYVSKPRVLLLHGELDPVVSVENGWSALAALMKQEISVSLEVFPGLGHSVSTEGLAAATTFLREVLKQ